MKRPIINVEEKIDCVAGDQIKSAKETSAATNNESKALASDKAKSGLRIPRGLYRFKTHEEADEWMTKMLVRSGMSETKEP